MGPKKIAILYHGGCPDGGGGAYAAWKKFGDAAEYIPAKYNRPVPENIEGKELYFIDFCYPQEVMDEVAKKAASVTVLDHHEGVRAVAEKFPGVFDSSRSGATIAWSYFHPTTPIPLLLTYIEDGDLYRFTLPHSRSILAYVYTSPFSSFEHWETLVRELEDPRERERVIATGTIFEQYHQHVVDTAVHHAELVRFEGYECYLASSTGEFVSDIGNILALKKPPIALIISADATDVRVSLRSNGEVDVSLLARRYGGNGHPAASGFRIPFGDTMPWEPIEKKNDYPRN